MDHQPVESAREYKKFAGVLLAILAASTLLTIVRGWTLRQFMNDFMAIFFMVFAAFKFLNIEMFSLAYRSYDLIAQEFKAWGYIFPFVEGALGFSYLLSNRSRTLYLITIIVTGIAALGVWQELRGNAQRRRPGRVMCACLGTFIQLPLSKVSFVEDFVMLVMAVVMFLMS